jgi:DNA polymerase-3 subunit epsilon
MIMREIVFDTETTGLSPADGHRLVEIGCIEMINKVETGHHFHRYIHPQRSMPSEAQVVHGLSESFLSDKPLFPEIVADLIEFVGDSPLIAHNAAFDFSFLNWELQACGFDPICLSRMIDTLAIARTRHPGAKHSLDALCTRYGVDRSQRVKHGALLDAQLLAQVYVELTGGRQIGFSLAETSREPQPEFGSAMAAVQRRFRPARPHAASEAELARHTAFVSTLTDPLWSALHHAA